MVAVAIVAGSLSAVLAGSSVAAERRPPNPNPLWEAYPLDPKVPKPETQPPASPPPAARPPPAAFPPPATPAPSPSRPAPAPPQESGTDWTSFALGGAGAFLLLLLSAVFLKRARRRPAAVLRPREAPPQLSGRETPAELIAFARALAKEAAAWDTYVDRQPPEGIREMTDIADHDPSTAPAAPSPPVSSGYADIGEHVAGVLSAAEAAANQIREDARANAEEILAAARREAEDVRRDAAAYDADTRAAVDSYASERRREAEQEVQKQLADSESQARATRQAAEAMARQIEEAGRQRGQALRDESKAVEERLKKALAGFRRVTVELEELVGAPAGGETLADALKPQPRQSEELTPLSVVRTDEP